VYRSRSGSDGGDHQVQARGTELLGVLFLNPTRAMVQEAQGALQSEAGRLLYYRTRNFATRMLILKTGRAAINLYSGNLRMSDDEIAAASQADQASIAVKQEIPVRTLLAGQVNADKSSTINAMAGELLCEVSPILTPAGTVEHVLQGDDRPAASIVDTPGITSAVQAVAAGWIVMQQCHHETHNAGMASRQVGGINLKGVGGKFRPRRAGRARPPQAGPWHERDDRGSVAMQHSRRPSHGRSTASRKVHPALGLKRAQSLAEELRVVSWRHARSWKQATTGGDIGRMPEAVADFPRNPHIGPLGQRKLL
jgi:hypothetical protein